MNERKTETIDLGRGVQYAKVADRSVQFHLDNELCEVKTSVRFSEGHVLFKARVRTKKGTFTGHSLGKLGGKEKAFEKLETIAVGRALAFAGYLADGHIACAEEMETFPTPEPPAGDDDAPTTQPRDERVSADQLAQLVALYQERFPDRDQRAFSADMREVLGQGESWNARRPGDWIMTQFELAVHWLQNTEA